MDKLTAGDGAVLGITWFGAKLVIVTVRKVRSCKLCKDVIPKGARAWWPIVESAPLVIRCDRLCGPCGDRIADELHRDGV